MFRINKLKNEVKTSDDSKRVKYDWSKPVAWWYAHPPVEGFWPNNWEGFDVECQNCGEKFRNHYANPPHAYVRMNWETMKPLRCEGFKQDMLSFYVKQALQKLCKEG